MKTTWLRILLAVTHSLPHFTGQHVHLFNNQHWPAVAPIGLIRFAEKSRNIVSVDLLWEKNTVLVEKISWKRRIIREANRADCWVELSNIVSISLDQTRLQIEHSNSTYLQAKRTAIWRNMHLMNPRWYISKQFTRLRFWKFWCGPMVAGSLKTILVSIH